MATDHPLLKDGFDTPREGITKLQLVFGASLDRDNLIPPYHSIPQDFRHETGKGRVWCRIQAEWFFGGLQDRKDEFIARLGVDPEAAWTHLATIQRSWEPKHEHKEAAVAWLMSRWFELPEAWR